VIFPALCAQPVLAIIPKMATNNNPFSALIVFPPFNNWL